jgi:hypothetical protein
MRPKIAERTLKADTTYNNKVYAQARKDAESNDKREDERDKRAKANLDIQNKALEAQIAVLNENHHQYIQQNEPHLQVVPDEDRGVEELEMESLKYITK